MKQGRVEEGEGKGQEWGNFILIILLNINIKARTLAPFKFTESNSKMLLKNVSDLLTDIEYILDNFRHRNQEMSGDLRSLCRAAVRFHVAMKPKLKDLALHRHSHVTRLNIDVNERCVHVLRKTRQYTQQHQTCAGGQGQ